MTSFPYKVGDRIKAHPNAWEFGERHCDIVSIGRKWARVRYIRSGKIVRWAPDALVTTQQMLSDAEAK